MDEITGDVIVDGHSADFVADLLVMDHTVPELREMASDLGVKRERGMSKRGTAEAIARQASHLLRVEEDDFGEKRVVPDYQAAAEWR